MERVSRHRESPHNHSPHQWPGVALPSELAEELKLVASAVKKEAGEIVELAPSRYMSPELTAALEELRELATGPYLRPEGLTFYSTQKLPSEETLRELMETITFDQELFSSSSGNFLHAADDPRAMWGDAKRLYHSTLMLDYVVMRHIGWVDPMDREWLLAEKVTDFSGALGCDYGFSLSRDLKAALYYGRPGFEGSFAEQLYQACGRKMPSALKALSDQTVVLAMNAGGLKSAFPTGKLLWVGTNQEFEVCCPLLPADIPEVGLDPIAIVRWKTGYY